MSASPALRAPAAKPVREAGVERELPRVSIVMPIFNEAKWIETSLGAVLRQDYPPDLVEILVADGESNDGTVERIDEMIRQNPGRRIRRLTNVDRTAGAALNLMIERATGDIVIRVDGHTEIAPNYVGLCVENLLRTDALSVGGCIQASGSGFVGRAVAAATGSFWGNGGARFRRRPVGPPTYVDGVPFGAWRCDTLSRLGPFMDDWPVNEDCEFMARIRHAGGKILLDPGIRATYFSRGSLRSLAHQYFRYGHLKSRVFVRHPRQIRPRQVAPLLLVLFLGACLAWGLAGTAPPFPPIIGPVAYLVALLLASVQIAARNRPRSSVFALPVVLATLHLSYGIGLALGVGRQLVSSWFETIAGRARLETEGSRGSPDR